MADQIPPMIVEILVETDKLKSQLANVQTQLAKVGEHAGKAEKPVHGLKGQFEELGKKLIKGAGLVEMVHFLSESTTASAENAKSQALLDRQLQVTTGATKEQTKAVDEHLESLSEQSGVLITQLRPAYTTLLRTTHDSTKALQLQKLALDVSAGTGKDLHTVTLALSKSLTGNAGALNRIVPGAKAAGDQIAFLQKNFHGAAKAAADSNPMQKFQVMMEKIKVTLGQALLPLMNTLIKILKPLMPIFNLLAVVFGMVVKAVTPLITKIMGALMPAFTAIAKVLTPILKSILPPLIKLLDKVLVPVLMFLSEVIAKYLVPYLQKMGDVFGWLLDHVVNFIVDAFNRMLAVLGPLWQFLKPIVDGIMALVGLKAEPVIAPKVDKSNMEDIADLTSNTGLMADGSGVKGTGDSKQVQLLKETQKKILDARNTYHQAVKDANDAYATDIRNQINAFRDVFRQATQINLGDLFSAGNRTADSLVESLKTKLAGITTFSQDIASIAGAGFSSDFVKEVMGLGPVAGHELAQAIMGATPEVQAQIQELYGAAHDASQNGVNDVASSMSDMFTQATQNLTDALQAATDTLNATLLSLKSNVTSTVTKVVPNGGSPAPTPTPTPKPTPTTQIIVNTSTNATPMVISNAVLNGIKFGSPIISTPVAPTVYSNWLANPQGIPAPITH
jgi:hypothetical protein